MTRDLVKPFLTSKIILFVTILLAVQIQLIYTQDGFATLGDGTTGFITVQ